MIPKTQRALKDHTTNMLRYLSVVLSLSLFTNVVFSQETFTIRGAVSDSSTGEPLRAANIRVLGTTKGTITNANGAYALTLGGDRYELMFSYLGYQPETLRVLLDKNIIRDVRLKQSPIEMASVVVFAEDPAVEIIRKAIANKRKWMEKLKSYRFDAYSKEIIRRDTAIAGIMEAYTTGFVDSAGKMREAVKQRRQTLNVSSAENFAAVRRIVNFNEDEIELFSMTVNDSKSSYRFIGPTAPDALDYYDYKLLTTYRTGGVEVYQIQMTPKSKMMPLFEGVITVADRTFAVMGVDLKPNEMLVIPFLRDINLSYRQQFALYDSLFWMPTDIRVDGGFTVSFVGLSLPRIGISRSCAIYDYEINAPVPDSIARKPELTVDSTTISYDSTFWAKHEVMPKTQEEQKAYKILDSTQTLEKQFEPKGPLASLTGDNSMSALSYINSRFNRVEGFSLGGKYTQSVTKYGSATASFGYGLTDKKTKYEIGASGYPTEKHTVGAGFELYRKLDNVPDEGFYDPLSISLMALFDKNDYRDYFLSTGVRLFATTKPSRDIEGTISFTSETEETMESKTNFSLFARGRDFRSNPSISDGLLRAFRADLRLGSENVALDLVPRNAMELSLEHSSPTLFKSDFDYTRYWGVILWHIETFSRNLLFAPTLRFQLSAGGSDRSLPPQRLFAPDTRASGYAQFGVLRGGSPREFVGDRFVMLNVEHNFRALPFIAAGIPFLYKNNIEIILQGSIAQTWMNTVSTSDGWLYEAGIGLNRIFDLLRADLTYRFKDPKGIFFSLSFVNLF